MFLHAFSTLTVEEMYLVRSCVVGRLLVRCKGTILIAVGLVDSAIVVPRAYPSYICVPSVDSHSNSSLSRELFRTPKYGYLQEGLLECGNT